MFQQKDPLVPATPSFRFWHPQPLQQPPSICTHLCRPHSSITISSIYLGTSPSYGEHAKVTWFAGLAIAVSPKRPSTPRSILYRPHLQYSKVPENKADTMLRTAATVPCRVKYIALSTWREWRSKRLARPFPSVNTNSLLHPYRGWLGS